MKRFLLVFLALSVLLSSFSLFTFADDSAELVCPECGSSIDIKDFDIKFLEISSYKCSNCDYSRFVYNVGGWNALEFGSPTDPVYKDGNTVYTLPGGSNPSGVPNLGPSGYPRYYLTPKLEQELSGYSVSGDVLNLFFKGRGPVYPSDAGQVFGLVLFQLPVFIV